MGQCKGTTADGSRCKREVADNEKYCYQHRPGDKENKSIKPDGLKEKAAAMLADPTVKTNKEVYETLDIPESTFYRWLDSQKFIDRVNSKIDKYTDRELAKVWKALIHNAVEEKDTKAIKLFFEMKGKYKQDIDLNVNQLPDINLVRGGDDG